MFSYVHKHTHAHTKLAKKVVGSLNMTINTNERRAQVYAIQDTLEKINGKAVRLASPSRLFVLSGQLVQLFNKANRHIAHGQHYSFHLFNDLLLCTTVPSLPSTTCRVKYAMPLNADLIIVDIPDYEQVAGSPATASGGISTHPRSPVSHSEPTWSRRGSVGSLGSAGSNTSSSSVHLTPQHAPVHKRRVFRHVIGVYCYSKQVELQCKSNAEKDQWLTMLNLALSENCTA
jgi:hypothetical protein